MNMIEARNITRMFPVGGGEFYALRHVDIDIPAGKLTILKGRSGSGKTTLMDRHILRWEKCKKNSCEGWRLDLSFRQLP